MLVKDALSKSLASGKVYLYSVNPSKNPEKPLDYTCVFAQKVNLTEDEGNSNELFAIAQKTQNFSSAIATARMSFKHDYLVEKGIIPENYSERIEFDDTNTICADDIFDKENINIQITESLEPNKNYSSHSPKINPTTGEVVMHNLQPVYRDSKLVIGKSNHILLKSDSSRSERTIKKSILESAISNINIGEPI